MSSTRGRSCCRSAPTPWPCLSDFSEPRCDKWLKLRIKAEGAQGWTTIPLVVAEVPGRTADFALVATHLDAWYAGMTDTTGTVASILEMARVLQKHTGELERGVRFAWWPGHSFRRYAGSTWFADRFWADLDEHCVAYTTLDGSGRRGSQINRIYAGAWPGDRRVEPRVRHGPDRLGARRAGRGLDTRYRVAELHSLVTRPALPLRLGPLVNAYAGAVAALAQVAGASFDFASTQEAIADLGVAAVRLDAAPPPTRAEALGARNRLLVRLTHRLNARLYTKAGRFDQDPAVTLPILALLARAPELRALPADGDARGFLETELVRGRNAVEATLREATREAEHFLATEARP